MKLDKVGGKFLKKFKLHEEKWGKAGFIEGKSN